MLTLKTFAFALAFGGITTLSRAAPADTINVPRQIEDENWQLFVYLNNQACDNNSGNGTAYFSDKTYDLGGCLSLNVPGGSFFLGADSPKKVDFYAETACNPDHGDFSSVQINTCIALPTYNWANSAIVTEAT